FEHSFAALVPSNSPAQGCVERIRFSLLYLQLHSAAVADANQWNAKVRAKAKEQGRWEKVGEQKEQERKKEGVQLQPSLVRDFRRALSLCPLPSAASLAIGASTAAPNSLAEVPFPDGALRLYSRVILPKLREVQKRIRPHLQQER